MPEIPRTKFNSPWTVAVIEAALNDVSSAKGSSESLTAALNAMRAEINSLSGGVHLKGAVDYYNDLPASPSEGDAYTVRYQGTSGTEPLGIEYAWATYQGTPQWIPIGVDPSVFAKQTEMDVVANAGAKNLLKFREDVTSSSAGNVYARANSDGTLSVGLTSGTTATAQLVFTLGSITKYRDRKLILSGCPVGGNYQSGYALYVANDGSTAQADTGSGATLPIVTGVTSSVVVLIVRSGTTISSELTFRPMIRPAEITDPTFQPFAHTNRELTVLTDEDRASLVELVDGGAKNFVQVLFTYRAATSTTPSITNNNDGTITINGTRTGSNYIAVHDLESDITSSLNTRYTLPAGKYVATTINNTYATLQVYMHDGTNMISLAQVASYDVDFEYTETDKQTYPYIFFRLNLSGSKSGITYNNVTIYPMVCTKAAWDISHAYQPYRPSWQEMWEMIQALQNNS